ncbi:hypothetical protein B9Z55_015199 [Caenorhabditis nigoni]|uniref:Uncharacterized protein n=1 Tax=Caenorhabditis nigoni TaxID=1611254 RepID=A0A2G5U958_9PELO|nr:hypothetical protein B9Z55_015199 [Caenorhabditis nigoni]
MIEKGNGWRHRRKEEEEENQPSKMKTNSRTICDGEEKRRHLLQIQYSQLTLFDIMELVQIISCHTLTQFDTIPMDMRMKRRRERGGK